MPKGSPKPQTIATAKYEAKGGWKKVCVKFHTDLVDEFDEVCKRTGTTKASVFAEAMKKFIEENKQG